MREFVEQLYAAMPIELACSNKRKRGSQIPYITIGVSGGLNPVKLAISTRAQSSWATVYERSVAIRFGSGSICVG